MIKKPSDTEAERLWMKINGKLVEDYTINVTTGVIEIKENFKDKTVMAHDKQSGAYIKFGEGVAKHWVKPEAPSAVPASPPASIKYDDTLFRKVSRVRLDQSTGLNQHNTAFTVEPIEGLHLLVHVSSDSMWAHADDLQSGLTAVMDYIKQVADHNELEV